MTSVAINEKKIKRGWLSKAFKMETGGAFSAGLVTSIATRGTILSVLGSAGLVGTASGLAITGGAMIGAGVVAGLASTAVKIAIKRHIAHKRGEEGPEWKSMLKTGTFMGGIGGFIGFAGGELISGIMNVWGDEITSFANNTLEYFKGFFGGDNSLTNMSLIATANAAPTSADVGPFELNSNEVTGVTTTADASDANSDMQQQESTQVDLPSLEDRLEALKGGNITEITQQTIDQAINGDANAQNELATLLFSCGGFFDEDQSLAIELYENVAQLGNRDALNSLNYLKSYGLFDDVCDNPDSMPSRSIVNTEADISDTDSSDELQSQQQEAPQVDLPSLEGELEALKEQATSSTRAIIDNAIHGEDVKVQAQAQKDIAMFVLNGLRGFQENPELATRLYENAAELGNEQAIRDLAYLRNIGVIPEAGGEIASDAVKDTVSDTVSDTDSSDELQSQQQEASQVDLPSLEGELEALKEQATPSTRAIIDNAIHGEDVKVQAQAQKDIAMFVLNGLRGFQENPELATRLYENAAELGNEQAIRDLAYLRNIGVIPEAGGEIASDAVKDTVSDATSSAEEVKPAQPEAPTTDADVVGGISSLEGELEALKEQATPSTRAIIDNAINGEGEIQAQAQKDIAMFVLNGLRGFEENPELAVRLYERAAELENTQAKVDLAYILYHGQGGIEPDMKTAMEEIQKLKSQNPQAASLWRAWNGEPEPVARPQSTPPSQNGTRGVSRAFNSGSNGDTQNIKCVWGPEKDDRGAPLTGTCTIPSDLDIKVGDRIRVPHIDWKRLAQALTR